MKIISFLLKDLPETNNYKVIFMKRALPEVLASQKKMLERRNEADESGDERMLELWENHLWRVRYLLKHARPVRDARGRLRRTSSEIRFARPGESATSSISTRAPETMAAAVDESLYRNRG